MQAKKSFLCFGRIEDSNMHFSTNARRVLFTGDGKVVDLGGVCMMLQSSSHACWCNCHRTRMMVRYQVADLNLRMLCYRMSR